MRWNRVVCTLGAASVLALWCVDASGAGAAAGATGPHQALAEGAAQSGDQAAVKTAATELLEQYTLALESLDADAVKKVQPSVDTNQLRNAFRQMRSLEVEIDTIEVLTATGNTARVSCRVKQTLEPRAGSKQTTTVTRVLRLRKPQASWIIEAFER